MRRLYQKLIVLTFLSIFSMSASGLWAAAIQTVKDGNWNDAEVWSGGIVPTGKDFITIRHQVVDPAERTILLQGQLTVASTGTYIVERDLIIQGKLLVSGRVEGGKAVVNHGQTTNNGFLSTNEDFDNYGVLFNYGEIRIGAGLENDHGTIHQFGLTRVQGDLENQGTIIGGSGMFRVCGDAEHDGVILGIAYLCMECDGDYEDDGEGTFILSCAPFPVVLSQFSGKLAGSAVVLNWTTTSEANAGDFIVERAVQPLEELCTLGVCDAQQEFVEIGRVASQGDSEGTQNYSFTDKSPETGVNFYRLKMMDLNGAYAYSFVIQVTGEKLKTNLEVYPNPNNEILNIRVVSTSNEESDLALYDIQGRKVWDKKVSLIPGEQSVVELQSRNYAAGTYIVEFRSGDQRKTKKVVFVK